MTSTEVKNALKVAADPDNGLEPLMDKDKTFILERKLINQMKFKDYDDILTRFPYPDDLGLHGEGENSVLTWKGLVIIPDDIKQDILSHEFKVFPSSVGRIRFLDHLNTMFVGISQHDVTKFLNGNSEAQIWKRKWKTSSNRLYIPSGPGQRIMIDFTVLKRGGKGNYIGISTWIDMFSKFVHCEWVTANDSATTANILRRVLAEKIFPEVRAIHTDGGSEYKGEFTELCKEKQIPIIRGRTYTPTAQANVEAMNRVIKNYVVSLETKYRRSHKEILRMALQAYNNTISPSTLYKPKALNSKDVPASILLDVRARLRSLVDNRSEKSAKWSRAHNPPLSVGDKVRIAVSEIETLRGKKIADLIKKGQYKSSHYPIWSKKVYTVETVFPELNQAFVEGFPDRFPRGALLLVPPDSKDAKYEYLDSDDDGEDVYEPPVTRSKAKATKGPVTRSRAAQEAAA